MLFLVVSTPRPDKPSQLAQSRQAEVAGSQTHTGVFGLAQLGNWIAGSFHSFWGQFGWMALPLSNGLYTVILIFLALTAVGWILGLLRPLAPEVDRPLTVLPREAAH